MVNAAPQHCIPCMPTRLYRVTSGAGTAQPTLAFHPYRAERRWQAHGIRRHTMAVDGTWTITISTPMGERQSTVALTTSGGTLTGTQSADGESTAIADGKVSGDEVAWKVS